jgi:restriction system protein
MQRAKKGVFITTSKFSADAVEFVSLIEKCIVLIDGETLTNLMVEYGLGVATKRTVEIKAIDTDYFLED